MVIMRVMWLIMVVFLSGCQAIFDGQHDDTRGFTPIKTTLKHQTANKDGPPPGPLPVKFKKVLPLNAPLSRYGNPGEYKVNGQTYEVLTNSTGYRVRGIASWYGTLFHRKRTSSGEYYDMYALTAAHKTLPIPCYVKVKNLDNGRVAIVKVNDRGPFHDGRVIDLSYAAAAKLGLFPKGTAHVEVEALAVKGSGASHSALYYIQAGAFDSKKLAESLQTKLAKLTPSPVFIERHQNRFIVRLGPFADRKMTNSIKNILSRHGVSGAFSLLL